VITKDRHEIAREDCKLLILRDLQGVSTLVTEATRGSPPTLLQGSKAGPSQRESFEILESRLLIQRGVRYLNAGKREGTYIKFLGFPYQYETPAGWS
jgi:hypothetical protein